METPSELRQRVLRLYAGVGSVFCASLLVLGSWREDPGPLAAAAGLIAAGALWLWLRRTPTMLDWIFPVAVVPAVCCAIGFMACGDRGLAYLAVMGAPVAWAAVLFELPVVIATLALTVIAVFVVVSMRTGIATGAVSAVLLSPLAAMVAWVVFATAQRLRRAREDLARQALELARSERLLAAAVEGSSLGYWEWDLRTDGLTYSAAWPALLGYAPGEIEPRFGSWVRLVHPDDVQRVRQEVVAHAKGEIAGLDTEYRMRPRQGGWRWVHTRGRVVARDERGRATRMTGTHADVTRRHEAEDRLRDAQEKLLIATRLASVGTLAAGVAHEINNPLAWVTSNLHYALDNLRAEGIDSPRRAEVRDALEETLLGAGRIAAIVKAMRSLGKPADAGEPQEIDVRVELRNAIQLAQDQLAERARLEVVLPEALPLARARTNELGRVFLNVLVNAAQAIPAGRAAENRIRVAARAEGDDVVVEVADSGAGIPADVRGRIFDPFFTTKPVGTGVGLGLSIARSIVEGAGGRIDFETEEGRGTTFRIRIPARTDAAPGGAGGELRRLG